MRTERRPMLFFVEGRILQEEVHYDQGMAVAVQTVDVTSELHKVLVVSGDPELDATDFAHPAWWRGSEYGFDQCMRAVTKILDGADAGGGVAREPWEGLRRRLMRLVARAGGDVQSSKRQYRLPRSRLTRGSSTRKA